MPVATNDSLMGLGMPAQLSALLGANPKAVTAAGTAQGTATAILSKNVELTTASSQTGGILPSNAGVMVPYFVTVQTSDTGVVYVPSGHYLNSVQNAGLSVAQYKSAIFWQYKPSYWCSILSA